MLNRITRRAICIFRRTIEYVRSVRICSYGSSGSSHNGFTWPVPVLGHATACSTRRHRFPNTKDGRRCTRTGTGERFFVFTTPTSRKPSDFPPAADDDKSRNRLIFRVYRVYVMENGFFKRTVPSRFPFVRRTRFSSRHVFAVDPIRC